MKRIIILYAHGSRDPRWRGTFECFASGLSKSIENQEIKLAYMEFAGPTLLDIVQEAYRNNHRDFILIPLFMAGGAHVGRDLPSQIAGVKESFPDIQVEIKPPIGEHPRIFEAMKEVIQDYAGR